MDSILLMRHRSSLTANFLLSPTKLYFYCGFPSKINKDLGNPKPRYRLESFPNASIRFHTTIFLGLGDLVCSYALRGGLRAAKQKMSSEDL
jgi:hypothetical protein